MSGTPNHTQPRPCRVCRTTPTVHIPNYADDVDTMVECETCGETSEAFVLGAHSEGVASAIFSWDAMQGSEAEREALNLDYDTKLLGLLELLPDLTEDQIDRMTIIAFEEAS